VCCAGDPLPGAIHAECPAPLPAHRPGWTALPIPFSPNHSQRPPSWGTGVSTPPADSPHPGLFRPVSSHRADPTAGRRPAGIGAAPGPLTAFSRTRAHTLPFLHRGGGVPRFSAWSAALYVCPGSGPRGPRRAGDTQPVHPLARGSLASARHRHILARSLQGHGSVHRANTAHQDPKAARSVFRQPRPGPGPILTGGAPQTAARPPLFCNRPHRGMITGGGCGHYLPIRGKQRATQPLAPAPRPPRMCGCLLGDFCRPA